MSAPTAERVKVDIALHQNAFHYRQHPEPKAFVLHPDETIDFEMDCKFWITFKSKSGHGSPFIPARGQEDPLKLEANKPSDKWAIIATVRQDAQSGRYPFQLTAEGSTGAVSDTPPRFEDDPEIIIER